MKITSFAIMTIATAGFAHHASISFGWLNTPFYYLGLFVLIAQYLVSLNSVENIKVPSDNFIIGFLGMMLFGLTAINSLIYGSSGYDVVKPLVNAAVLTGCFLAIGRIDIEEIYRGLNWGLFIVGFVVLCLIIFYLTVPYKVDYVGTNFFEKTRYGRNQLAYFLPRLVLLWFIACLIVKKFEYKGLFGVVIGGFFCLMSGSRGGFLLFSGLLFWLVIGIFFVIKELDRKIWGGHFVKIIVFIGVICSCLISFIPDVGHLEVNSRVHSLVDSDSVPFEMGRNSFEERFGRVNEGVGVIMDQDLFFRGHGINFTEGLRGLPHFDLISVGLASGVIGCVFYLGFFGYSGLIFAKSIREAEGVFLPGFFGILLVVMTVLVGAIYDQAFSLYPYILVAIGLRMVDRKLIQ